MHDILVASKNRKKIQEIGNILRETPFHAISAYEMVNTDIDIEETGQTFEENAKIKALTLSGLTDEFVLADDSGLCVDYLDGRPGVFSARYAGGNASDTENNRKLLSEMKGVEKSNRTARFVCVLCLCKKGTFLEKFTGECYGHIADEEAGSGGFGYDPVFMLHNGMTMAEIGAEEKNRISHRYKALEKLKSFLVKYGCEI